MRKFKCFAIIILTTLFSFSFLQQKPISEAAKNKKSMKMWEGRKWDVMEGDVKLCYFTNVKIGVIKKKDGVMMWRLAYTLHTIGWEPYDVYQYFRASIRNKAGKILERVVFKISIRCAVPKKDGDRQGILKAKNYSIDDVAGISFERKTQYWTKCEKVKKKMITL